MNVGFYVDSVAATPQNGEIFEALNEAVDNKDITDASVFFLMISIIILLSQSLVCLILQIYGPLRGY